MNTDTNRSDTPMTLDAQEMPATLEGLDLFLATHGSTNPDHDANNYLEKNIAKLIPEEPSLSEVDPELMGMCEQLDLLIEDAQWDKHVFEDEAALVEFAENIMRGFNNISANVLKLIKGGRVRRQDLLHFYRSLAPLTCNNTFVGAAHWSWIPPEDLDDGERARVNSQYLGSSYLMTRIRKFHALKEAKGGLLNLKDEYSLIEVACMTAPASVSVLERSDFAANCLVDYRSQQGQASKPVRLGELAGGDGALSNATLERLKAVGAEVTHHTLVDVDKRALDRITAPTLKVWQERFLGLIQQIVQLNILRETDKLGELLSALNEVQSMGFADYLKHPVFVALLQFIILKAPPDTLVEFGVFKTGHPDDAFIRLGLLWPLITRTPEELAVIGKEAGLLDVEVKELIVGGDPKKTCQLVLLGRTPSAETLLTDQSGSSSI